MGINEIINAIQKEVAKGNEEFFGYAWREKMGELGEFLEEESKYAKLVEWIDKELEQCNSLKNVFCPADRTESTTISMVNNYGELMKKLAILVHCKELLLDSRTTIKMRENIEYTLCKLYRIRYNKQLKSYV
jgi:hypothetical protein